MIYVDNPFISPSVLSFCPGILGIERGLARAGVNCRVVAYVEIEAFIIADLVAGMEAGMVDPTPIWTDIKTFNPYPFRNKIHGITGGYPCQPFSSAGKGEGENDPRHLWPYLEYSIYTIKPVWCFFENVANHLNIGYETVKRSLETMGYKVKEGIYSAEEVGAPHQRKRLFILAILGNTKGKHQWNDWYQSVKSQFEDRRSGFKLADSHGDGHGAGFKDVQNKSGEIEVPPQRENWQRSRDVIGDGGTVALANADCTKRSQSGKYFPNESEYSSLGCSSEDVSNSVRNNGKEIQNKERKSGIGQELISNGNTGGVDRWPAGIGVYQHEWEEPRTSGYINRLPSSIRSMWSASRKNFAKMLGEKVFTQTEYRIKAHFESGMGCTINGYNFREDILRAFGNSVVEQTAELAFIDLLNKHIKNLE